MLIRNKTTYPKQEAGVPRIKLSILIASYNRPGYLRDCIASILESDYHDFEIIISDDHSSRIREIKNSIESYRNLPCINFIEQPHNIGMAENWNYLVSVAKGDYIILLGDDDKIFPHTLSKIDGYIKKYKGYSLYAFGYEVIDECDSFQYSRYSPKAFKISLSNRKFLRSLFVSSIIPFWAFHPFTICYERQIGKEIKYNKEALIGADLLFLYDCMNGAKEMFVIPEVLFSWRKIYSENTKGVKNLSLSGTNDISARENILRILRNRNDLNPFISSIISSNWYEKRFLLDSISFKELPSSKYKIKFLQLVNYIKLFGLHGVFSLLKYTLQYYSKNARARNK